MPEPGMSDLQLATIEEIWEELIRRTKAAVLILMMHDRNTDSERSAATYVFHGGYQTAVGLVTWAQSRLLSSHGDEEDDEEE